MFRVDDAFNQTGRPFKNSINGLRMKSIYISGRTLGCFVNRCYIRVCEDRSVSQKRKGISYIVTLMRLLFTVSDIIVYAVFVLCLSVIALRLNTALLQPTAGFTRYHMTPKPLYNLGLNVLLSIELMIGTDRFLWNCSLSDMTETYYVEISRN